MHADLFPETLPPAPVMAPTCVVMMTTQMPPRPQHIAFRDTTLVCLEKDEEVFVALRPIVEGMGLSWPRQYRKLTEDVDRFCVALMATQMPGDDQAREHVFIPLERLFGWLMTIQPSRVNPASLETVIAYQRECDRILFHHFFHDLRTESSALRMLRATTVAVARLTLEGLSRAEIAVRLGKSPAAVTYHRRSARRLGLLPVRRFSHD